MTIIQSRIGCKAAGNPSYWSTAPPATTASGRRNCSDWRKIIACGYQAWRTIIRACPTLLVDGEHSPRIYRANVEALAKWIPRVSHRTISGASHGLTATYSGIFNRMLAGFIISTRGVNRSVIFARSVGGEGLYKDSEANLSNLWTHFGAEVSTCWVRRQVTTNDCCSKPVLDSSCMTCCDIKK